MQYSPREYHNIDGDGKKKCFKMSRGVLVVGGVAIFSLVVVVVFLASLYGGKQNCDGSSSDVSKPTMVHFPQIKDTPLTKLVDAGGSNSFMKAVAYSLVAGTEMQGGVLRLDAGPPLEYTHWYEGIMFILIGEFNITDGAGQTFSAIPGDSMYIPRGTTVTYRAAATSYMYYAMQPPGAEKCAEIKTAIASNPTIVRANNTADINITFFKNDFNSLSYLQDLLLSNIKGRELTGGLYKLLKGPALDYMYTYEEFKYIVEGEFHLTDGTGKIVKAKAGDLMHFPKGTFVRFESPNYALGFYVGQRKGGSA